MLSTANPQGARARRPRTQLEKNAAGIPDGSYTPSQGRRHRGRSKLAPSPYWSDQTKAQRTTMPPPADHTPMVECRSGDKQCGGRFYPFYYGDGCTCADCVNNRILREKRAWEEFENGVISNQPAVSTDDPHAHDEIDDVDEPDPKRAMVYEQLRSIGLTDREIVVLARSREGHTQREVARLCEISQTWVCFLISSALTKITRAGLKLKEMPAIETPPPKMIKTDPDVIDQLVPVAGVAHSPPSP